MRHGKGIWKSGKGNNLDRYEGEFLNNKKSGQGVFTWASNNIYKGMYNDDLRHGYGEMTWINGNLNIISTLRFLL